MSSQWAMDAKKMLLNHCSNRNGILERDMVKVFILFRLFMYSPKMYYLSYDNACIVFRFRDHILNEIQRSI